MDYRSAGVDIDAAVRAKERIRGLVRSTFTSGTLGWRRSSTEIGDHLMFDTRAGNVTSFDQRKFSIDNVVIQNIPAIPGDVDGDGYVDEDDAAVLAANWGVTAGATWATGDFNYDGKVNAADAAILAANWNPAPGESTAVPELSTLAGTLAGLLSLAWIRRKR